MGSYNRNPNASASTSQTMHHHHQNRLPYGSLSPHNQHMDQKTIESLGFDGWHSSAATQQQQQSSSSSSGAMRFGIEQQQQAAKKKTGRPRKYAPDGNIGLDLVPTSPLPSASNSYGGGDGGGGGGGDSGGGGERGGANTNSCDPPAKRNRGRPPGSGKKQLDALGGTGGVGFTPHVIEVKSGEKPAPSLSFSLLQQHQNQLHPPLGILMGSYNRNPNASASTSQTMHHHHQNRLPYGSLSPHNQHMDQKTIESLGFDGWHSSAATQQQQQSSSSSSGAMRFGIEQQQQAAKKKTGRPRKYAPDGNIGLDLVPTSPFPSASNSYGGGDGGGGGGGDSGGGGERGGANTNSCDPPAKRNRGRPPGSGKKQLDALGGTGGVGFTPHVIEVKSGEVMCCVCSQIKILLLFISFLSKP